MPQATTETIRTTIDQKPHSEFFRQSGWLMMASIIGGFMTLGVHFLTKFKAVDESQYAAFVTLLMIVACVPTIPLQMVFAHQTASALALGRERQLAKMLQLAWLWTSIIWLIGAAAVFIFQNQIVAVLQLPGASDLWVTMFMLLFSLWTPIFSGALQGRQDFFWVGWGMIFGCAGRIAGAVLLAVALRLGAAGMIAGALAGVALTTIVSMWRTRDLWSLAGEQFDGKKLLREVLPLVFGFGAGQFMFTSDTMFAKAFFGGDQMAQYAAAGTLSRALLWLVMPLASVMFPKLVHANVRAEKTNLFLIVALGTAALTFVGGLGLWIFGPLAIKIVYKSSYLGAASLIPWYAGAMVPLAMANVMVNDLLARARFGVVPWMVLLAVGYGLTLLWALHHFPGRMQVVLQTLAIFNLLLFVVCAVFSKIQKAPA